METNKLGRKDIKLMNMKYELVQVVNIQSYGIFVKNSDNVSALGHYTKLQKNIKQYKKGDYIWGSILKSDTEGKYDFLECAFCKKEELFEEFIDMHSEGDVVKGKVINVDHKYGVFLEIYPGINALFHKSEYNEYINAESMSKKEVVSTQIGMIDKEKKKISLINMYKKNVNVATEITGVQKEKFLETVGISPKVCSLYRECTNDTDFTDSQIREIVAKSYREAVADDTVLLYKDSFTFQIQGRTKYGGVIAATGQKNSHEGKEWYLKTIGSSAKLAGNAIELFAYVDDWSKILCDLKEKLLSGENWNYKSYEGKHSGTYEDLFILKQYLNYTFYCAKNKGLVAMTESKDFAAFNTGLVDNVYEAIYACFIPSASGAKKRWKYAGVCTYGTGYLGKMLNSKMIEPPKKVQYFSSINDMLFDTTKNLNWDKEHVLIENINRLPITFVEDQCDKADLEQLEKAIGEIKSNINLQKNYEYIRNYITDTIKLKRKLLNRLDDAVALAVKRCEWNYKTAIPIYYHVTNGISLLLPLCLSDDEQAADVALVVEKQESGNYQGQTILTLQMAYLDARLICRPNSEWLDPDKLVAVNENDF